MKNLKLLKALSFADDKYIEEASPRGRKPAVILGKRLIAAACICLIFTGISLWLFTPSKPFVGEISQYKDSEYFPLIEKMNTYGITPPRYENNFMMTLGVLENLFNSRSKGEDSIALYPTATGIPQEYKEVTDNQVSGIIEGDRIKRSDKYIYYLGEHYIFTYEVGGESQEPIGRYEIPLGYTAIEFYLSENCEKITLIGEYFTQGSSFVRVTLIDASDPSSLAEEDYFELRGSYLSSRVSEGKLILTAQFHVRTNPDYSDEKNFIPQYSTGEGFESMDADAIISPDKLDSSDYTLLFMLDENTLDLTESYAFLSYSEEIYVSVENIYLSRRYEQEDENGQKLSMTDISRLYYSPSGFDYKNTYTVCGSVKDQYSLDEKEGILRVVTTTNASSANGSLLTNNASLYCIEIESGETVASVENFAPQGESVYSVRFSGDSAYVCTALYVAPEIFKDPVYFFDLSDMQNITYTETGTIAGYSSSLIDLGEGYLLGVGVGDNGVFKLSVYTEENGRVITVCEHTEDVYRNYSENYKSYFIDRENNLFGLALSDAPRFGQSCYALFGFDGYKIKTIFFDKIEDEGSDKPNVDFDINNVRACLIDGELYVFADTTLTVRKIF